MGSAPDQLPADAAASARANGRAALSLLSALMRRGLEHLVLCPGSRSAPLAVAAALLEPHGLRLHTAIDERSAAFFALGLGRALGRPAAVVTTSGTAVAQLLAAAVEADLGTIPLLLLSADRPQRLKNCGANQAVPQERFLLACCRRLVEGPPAGLAAANAEQLEDLAAAAVSAACGDGCGAPAGPVHCNLPFEEPLHADGADLAALTAWLTSHIGVLTAPVDDPEDATGGALGAVGEAAREPRSQGSGPPVLPCPHFDDGRETPPPEHAGDRLIMTANLVGDRRGRAGQPGWMVTGAAEPTAATGATDGPDPLPSPWQLDPDRPGVVVAGPWRGSPQQWQAFCQALRRWQRRSGWPVLADALSGLRGMNGLAVVCAYDPLLQEPASVPAVGQVLRLGSLPASRRLQRWLEACGGHQVLVSQGDPRRLDPLGIVAAEGQWSAGLTSWVEAVLGPVAAAAPTAAANAAALVEGAQARASHWLQLEAAAQQALEQALPTGNPAEPPPPQGSTVDTADGGAASTSGADRTAQGVDRSEENGTPPLREPWLARALSRLLPAGLPVMLASSSPVRDWESFAAADAPWRPIHGFRGASGIDGTLSIACGLAEALGRLVLVSGDLALLHDANGWLWARQLRGRLTVLLIENGGGGIFEQLPIRAQPPERLDFERLFAMPQNVDQLALAALHGVPGRRLRREADLPDDLTWALDQPFALLELRTGRRDDAALRQRLRQAVSAAASESARRMAALDPERP